MRVAWISLIALWGFAGCLVDADNPCGEGLYLEDDICICDPGSVFDLASASCITCGEDQHEQNGTCVCDDGLFMQAGVCISAPDGWGDACTTDGAACPGSLSCHADTGTSGYCTTVGCTDDDCFAGYVCESDGSAPFCMRLPLGLGQSCEDSSDCAGTEATYCETFQTNSCIVEGCTLTPNDCFPGFLCCNFSALGSGHLCIYGDTCPF